MTPKEKAEELVKQFRKVVRGDKFSLHKQERIQCAIIEVEALIKHSLSLDKCIRWGSDNMNVLHEDLKFLEEVLKELKAMQ